MGINSRQTPLRLREYLAGSAVWTEVGGFAAAPRVGSVAPAPLVPPPVAPVGFAPVLQ